MDWEEHLITLYLRICKEYHEKCWICCQRFTNGGCKKFTDEEAMTIYILGVLNGYRTIKAMHLFARNFLASWFPTLPNYPAFIHRINRLHEAFREFIASLQAEKVTGDDEGEYLVDSFPIMLARHNHAYTAKVASEIASKSYNSTKKMYYYGVKAHVVARKREETLPDLEILVLDEAARQDGPVFDQMRPWLHDNLLFGDQAYKRPDEKKIEMTQSLKVFTPIKKKKGQKKLDDQSRVFSNAVSRMRQPIETLFGWIEHITNVQNAGLVRSTAGLLTHIFGKFAAAMIWKTYPEFTD